jgi:hypothetical protein
MSFSISMMGTAVTALLIAGVAPSVARADDADLVLQRVQSLEKELAAVKKENEALRHIKRLREENAALTKSQPAANAPQGVAAGNPRDAYAADMPIYAKAAVPAERGRLRVWGEGGAIWSGGDPVYSFFDRFVFSGGLLNNETNNFGLIPKVGWEAAGGFDYRLAASPWHVSGQFRHGEGRRAAALTFSQTIVPPVPPPTPVALLDAPSASYRETHWLADLAVGRDVFGNGPDALQFKFGVRVAELQGNITASNFRSEIVPAVFSISATTIAPQEIKFLGAGPRFGLEGSAPIGMGWTLDYLGDVAALFGTQNFQRTTSADGLIQGAPFRNPPVVDTAQKSATVFNADIQVGVSYWMTQNLKVSASYRLDSYFNVFQALDLQNDPTKLQKIDRYTHGPRLAVTAQF